MKKILIISEAHLVKTFLQTTVRNLEHETDVQFDCFITSKIDEKTFQSLKASFHNVFVNEYPKGIIQHIPKVRILQAIFGLRKIAKTLGSYDIVHIHFFHYYYYYILRIIKSKTKKLFLTFFGSDFNEVRNYKHWHNQKTMSFLDGIFATNDLFLKKIISRYNISSKDKQTGILEPVMENFVSFESFLNSHTNQSAKLKWNLDKKVIVGGYNAAPIMRHKLMIDTLSGLSKKLLDYTVIFPMTYGNRAGETRALVKHELESSPFDFLILENYLSVDMLQALRLATDIFINIPSRDQMASSLMEHLAAGSVVITGKWLPYDDLLEQGIYYITVETPDELPHVLSSVLENMSYHQLKSKANRETILNLMSWNTLKLNWYKYYGIEPKNKE